MSKSRGIIVTLIVLSLLGIVAAIEMKRKAVSVQLQELQGVQVEETSKGQEAADQIIQDIRKLIDIPEDEKPTVATIIDIKMLQAQNPFYAKAQNGDHLILTPTRAILYSSQTKKIIDVVPVLLEPVVGEGGSAEE